MTKAKTPKVLGAIRGETKLMPKTRNATRWTSTFVMVERYFAMEEVLEKQPALRPLKLKPDEKQVLSDLRPILQDLHSVMVQLQSQDLTMGQVRLLFDATMERYPELNTYLHPDSDIVCSQAFENAIVKLEWKRPLSPEEETAVKSLLVCNFSLVSKYIDSM